MEWVLVKTLLSLAAVLGLMVGVVFLLKKFVYGDSKPSSTAVDIQVLGSRSLSPKKSISVIAVMGRILVVGLSEQGVALLTEFDAEEVPDEPPLPKSPRTDNNHGAMNGGPFLAHLGRSFAKLLSKEQGTRTMHDQKQRSAKLKSAPTSKHGAPSVNKTVQRRRKVRSEYV